MSLYHIQPQNRTIYCTSLIYIYNSQVAPLETCRIDWRCPEVSWNPLLCLYIYAFLNVQGSLCMQELGQYVCKLEIVGNVYSEQFM